MDATERKRRVSAEAADWFVRLQSADLPREERTQFVNWLQESHLHVAELMRVTQVHGALEQFDRWAGISTAGSMSKSDNVVQLAGAEPGVRHAWRTGHSRSPRRTRLLGLAAAAAALLVTTAILLPKIRGQIIDTERGERREVVLNDGSVLQVDPETRLRVKYAERVRQIFLEHGRALFRVAKNANRPFLVQADGTTVRAVGTAFGVERQPQGLVVTVAEGKVAVAKDGEQSQTLPSPAKTLEQSEHADEGSVFLVANQQVTIQRSGSAEPVREVDSHRELAWAEGRLIFHNDDVSKVIAEFNHYNRVQLSVTDPALASRPISGVFNASEPEAFIAFLQSVTAVDIVRDGDKSITIVSIRAH